MLGGEFPRVRASERRLSEPPSGEVAGGPGEAGGIPGAAAHGGAPHHHPYLVGLRHRLRGLEAEATRRLRIRGLHHARASRAFLSRGASCEPPAGSRRLPRRRAGPPRRRTPRLHRGGSRGGLRRAKAPPAGRRQCGQPAPTRRPHPRPSRASGRQARCVLCDLHSRLAGDRSTSSAATSRRTSLRSGRSWTASCRPRPSKPSGAGSASVLRGRRTRSRGDRSRGGSATGTATSVWSTSTSSATSPS